MAHVQKFTAGSADRIIGHCEREKSDCGDFLKYRTTSDIEISKTHLNMPLHFDDKLNAHERLKKRLSEVHVFKRKDVNVMCDWVITYPQELSQDKERLKKFFGASVLFLMERYGKENVVSCNIHMDESQPHMHFCFVPVVFDSKKGYYKVSAKEVLTRHDLNTFHTDLEEYLYENIGIDKGLIHSGVTKEQKGNKTVKELKQETAKAENELREKQIELIELKKDIQSYKIEKQEIHDEILELEKKRHQAEKRLSEIYKTFSSVNDVWNQKSAEIENYKLVEDGLIQRLDTLKAKYENNKFVLSKMAEDIKNLPGFIDEYKEKLYRETKTILSKLVAPDQCQSYVQNENHTSKKRLKGRSR